MKNTIKMVILMFLIGLSLYQMTRLWFDDLSDFNLFYNAQDAEIIDKDKYFIKPDTLAIYTPNSAEGYSWIKQNRKEFDDIFLKSINLMKVMLVKGEFVEEVPIEEIWQRRNILLKYDYEIDPSLLLDDLNINNLSFARKVRPFNEIIIAPEENIGADVYFINDENYNDIKAYHMEYRNDKTPIDTLTTELEEGLKDKVFPYYKSSRELNLSKFEENENVLIPDGNVLEANTITFSKPFFVDGVLDEDELRTYINGFSRYNDYKLSINDENDEKLTFMDIDDSVHLDYYQSGFVVYNSDKSTNKKNISPIDAFYRAEEFIKNKDKIIKDMEYSLADYRIEENRVTFYYKYKFHGIDVDITKEILQPLDMKYPVEITIEDGQVTIYKRYLLKLENSSQQEEYTLAYKDVLDRTFIDHPDENKIQDISLRYLLNSDTQTLHLNWVVETENIIYPEPIN